jgi:glycosyltransferase involved in cell wall biosynthesis
MEARLLVKAGFEVNVVTSGVQYMTGKDIRPGNGWCTEEWRDNIRILRTWAPSDHRQSLLKRTANYLSYTVLAGLATLIHVKKVDRIFAGTDPVFIMPMVFFVSMVKQAPVVLDERDLFPETAMALGVIREGFLSRILFRMQQFFRKRASAILAATPGIRGQLIRYGWPDNKVHLLYNADVFLEEDFEREINNTPSLKQGTGKTFLVGYAGGLGRANDVATLLRAANHLKDLGDLGIVIIGSGEMLSRYRTYCQRNRLDNVFFFDSVPRIEARSFLKQMDLCVQPLPAQQHFSHTLTSKTFDYHGLGKPMIFCGRGDTVQLLKVSGGGVAVEPEDELGLAENIRRFYKNESLRLTMGSSARQWFQQNIEIEAACNIFRQVMTSDGPV